MLADRKYICNRKHLHRIQEKRIITIPLVGYIPRKTIEIMLDAMLPKEVATHNEGETFMSTMVPSFKTFLYSPGKIKRPSPSRIFGQSIMQSSTGAPAKKEE